MIDEFEHGALVAIALLVRLHDRPSMASEWDEGFDGFDAEQDAEARSERARKAAIARWRLIFRIELY